MLKRLLKRQGVGGDIALSVGMQGVDAVLKYFLLSSVSRAIGNNGFDLYSELLIYITIASACIDFGIAAVIYPRIAINPEVGSVPFRAALWLRVALTFLGSLVLIAATWLSGNSDLTLPILYAVLGFITSARFTAIRQIFELIWRIRGRSWLVTTISAIDSALTLASVLYLQQSSPLSVANVFFLIFVCSIPGFLIISVPLITRWRRHPTPARPIRLRYYRAILFAALPISIMGISGQLFGRIEPLVVKNLIGREAVGDFSAAVYPLTGTIFIPITISMIIFPLVTQVLKKTRSDVQLDWILGVGIKLLLATAILVGIGTFVLARPIMNFFNPDYVNVAWILKAYCLTNVFEYCIVFLDQSLIASGQRKEVMIGTLGALVMAALFSGFLGSWFAISGILAGKMFAAVAKIIYQTTRFEKEYRHGLYRAYAMGGTVVALLALLFWLTSSSSLVVQLVSGLGVGGGALFLTRIVDVEELRQIRKLQVS